MGGISVITKSLKPLFPEVKVSAEYMAETARRSKVLESGAQAASNAAKRAQAAGYKPHIDASRANFLEAMDARPGAAIDRYGRFNDVAKTQIAELLERFNLPKTATWDDLFKALIKADQKPRPILQDLCGFKNVANKHIDLNV